MTQREEILNNAVESVIEFHKAFNLPIRTEPTRIPPMEFTLRYKLLLEEVQELEDAYCDEDLVEVLDAIIDSMYILIGTAVQFGIADKLSLAFKEVHRSNMSKLEDGKGVVRSDGKVLKGKNYLPPDLLSILYSEDNGAEYQGCSRG